MEELSHLKWRYMLARNVGYRTVIVSENAQEIISVSRHWLSIILGQREMFLV